MTKQRLLFLASGLLAAAWILTACAGAQPAPVTASAAPDPAEAPVSEVEVLRLAGDPGGASYDLRLVVRGTLPDACLRTDAAAVERKGRLVEVHLPVTRAATGCPTVPLAYEQVVRLPSEALPPGSYTLLVNGALFSFEVSDLRADANEGKTVEAVAVGTVAEAAAALQTEETGSPAPETTAVLGENQQGAETTGAADEPVAAAPKVLGGEDLENCYEAALVGEPNLKPGALFDPAEAFTITWKLRNAGTCAWDSSYALVSMDSDGMDLHAEGPVPLPDAEPGEVVEVSAPVLAPIAPGPHQGSWVIAAPGGHFFGLGGSETYPLEARIITRAMQPDVLTLDLQCGASRGYNEERQIYDLINAERAKVGLSPVEWVDNITQVAAMYSYELACYNRDFVDIHRGRDGFLYPVRLQSAGILFETSNEMIYGGNGGPAGAVKWWLQSPIHKPIMLSERYTKVGIGYVVLPSLPYQQRVTVDFIK